MSFMKKMTTGMQWVKVRAGKAEVSEEDPEFKARMEVYDVDKLALKQMLHDVENEAEWIDLKIKAVQKKVENIERIHGYAEERKYAYDAELVAYSKREAAGEAVSKKQLEKLRELILAPTKKLVKEELATAHRLKQRYNDTHLALDAYREKFEKAKDGEPKEKAQAALDQAQQEYNEAKDAFVRQLDVVEEQKTAIFTVNLPAYNAVAVDTLRELAQTAEDSRN